MTPDRAQLRRASSRRPRRCSALMPDAHLPARPSVGIVGRSGTLGYEAADADAATLGIGVSTSASASAAIPINGSSFKSTSSSPVRGGPGDRRGRDDRRDRRPAGGREAAALHPAEHMTKPVSRLRRRPVERTKARPPDGPRRRDHPGRRREPRRRRSTCCRDAGVAIAPHPLGDRRDRAGDAGPGEGTRVGAPPTRGFCTREGKTPVGRPSTRPPFDKLRTACRSTPDGCPKLPCESLPGWKGTPEQRW